LLFIPSVAGGVSASGTGLLVNSNDKEVGVMASSIKPFQVAASLDGVSPLKDGGMSVRFHTQEIPKEEQVNLIGYYQQFGYLLFKPDAFKESEIPEKNTDIEGKRVKTPSQRLRATLWVLGDKKGHKTPEEQDIFYQHQMERFIDKVKEQIEIEENNGR
jgi:hypothetical protein